MKTDGGVEMYLYAFSHSALDGGEWSVSRPGSSVPEEGSHDTHCTRGCVGTKLSSP